MEDNLSMDWNGWSEGNDFRMIQVLHLLCPLFLLLLHQLHLRSSDIRSWRLVTPVLERSRKETEKMSDIFEHLENNIHSLVVQFVKNLPTVQETWVQSLSQKYPLKEEMAITWAPRGNHMGSQGKSRGPPGAIT